MNVILGTVHSAYANNNLAPWVIIPPCSCSFPGKNPGTSTNDTIGMLNASQNLTNHAPLTEALMSRQPANICG